MGQGGQCLEEDLAENQPKQETSLKEGVLFIRDAKERESPKAGPSTLAPSLAGSPAKPSPVASRGRHSLAGRQEPQRPRTSLTLP